MILFRIDANSLSRPAALLLALLIALTGLGCQSYKAKPLTDAAVEDALKPPAPDALRIQASELHHPILRSAPFDPKDGLTPDEAAVIAVLINPSLKSARDARQVSAAQLLSAGILTNPQLTASEDIPFGAPPGTVHAFGIGVNWDLVQLISRDAKVRAAQASSTSVDLSVAWQEWQLAQAARTAVYDLIALRAQLHQARDVDAHLADNLKLIQTAVDRHQKTVLDLAAAEASSLDAHTAVLSAEHDVEHQEFTLRRAMGLPPDAPVALSEHIVLPSHIDLPPTDLLLARPEKQRLDLLALKRGYESQEETLRAAILGQFPKINIGFNRARDNTNVNSVGWGATVDLPIFDRNQGVIASEKATRQQLYDEYVQRVFETRSDVATAVAEINSINRQIAADAQAIPSLQKLVDTYQSNLTHGNLDVLSYYTAVNNVSLKRIDMLKLQQQLIDDRIALEIALGEYLPESAATTEPTN